MIYAEAIYKRVYIITLLQGNGEKNGHFKLCVTNIRGMGYYGQVLILI